MSVVQRILSGDLRAAARLMRDLDDHQPEAVEDLKALYAHGGRALVVGITGPPGAGKSTLVDALITHYRALGERVGVVAVDPSSPFTGGAILGDRIRMGRHALDPGVFIRSLASRGHLGGLSRSTGDVICVLEAMGFDRVLVETVGVGQGEVEVVETAHLSVVVLVPGLGDEVQAIKAGILEIADVLCLNKADRDGADRALRDLELMLSLREGERAHTPIVRTVAATGEGVATLASAITDLSGQHDPVLWQTRQLRRARRQVLELLKEQATQRALTRAGDRLDALLVDLAARRTDPYSVVEALLAAD
ncbi:MAG: methylmalonyl Co-A mutase-associated GTPase MeaB [Deltaproteobacteria bacterium]|nr:methylmalonyl Co-A mutase-associated GTPase MeaB [Deltaproteobacteria bacterium]